MSLAALYLALRTFYFDDETMTPLAKRTGEVKQVTRDSQFQMHHEVVSPGLLPRRDNVERKKKKILQPRCSWSLLSGKCDVDDVIHLDIRLVNLQVDHFWPSPKMLCV